MILNKYSSPKDKNSTVIGSYADKKTMQPSSSATTTPSFSLDRTLFGNADTGQDIDDDLIAGGNITAGAVSYDDDENPIYPDHEFPSDSGNIFAENSIESPEVYGNKLFLDYENQKTDVLELIKKLTNALDSAKYGAKDQPVVLLSGRLYHAPGPSGSIVWVLDSQKLDAVELDSVAVVTESGTSYLTINLKGTDDFQIALTSAQLTIGKSVHSQYCFNTEIVDTAVRISATQFSSSYQSPFIWTSNDLIETMYLTVFGYCSK